ncbi:MAG: hypothetical protein EPN34_08275 [Burkholderiaceae bacterium]|nr:MAG: hypothetical protein EPN34_08275 [Burkholderiaceae bacterium]
MTELHCAPDGALNCNRSTGFPDGRRFRTVACLLEQQDAADHVDHAAFPHHVMDRDVGYAARVVFELNIPRSFIMTVSVPDLSRTASAYTHENAHRMRCKGIFFERAVYGRTLRCRTRRQARCVRLPYSPERK